MQLEAQKEMKAPWRELFEPMAAKGSSTQSQSQFQ